MVWTILTSGKNWLWVDFGHQKSGQVPRHEDHFWANVLDFEGPF